MDDNRVIDHVTTCDICKDVNTSSDKRYCFKVPSIGQYKPDEYLKGCQRPEILIIAINPRGPIGSVHEITKEQLSNFKPSGEINARRFYSKYKGISQLIYNNWCSNESVVAETDLFKCFSPKVDDSVKDQLIKNCFPYLNNQLINLSENLKIIICNGVTVSKKIKQVYKDHLVDFVTPFKDINFQYANFKVKDEHGFKNMNAIIIFLPFLSGRFPPTKERIERVRNIIDNDILKQRFPELLKKLGTELSFQPSQSEIIIQTDSGKNERAIEQIQEQYELPEYLKVICSDITLNNASLQSIKNTLDTHNINYAVAKADFIHLIFEYIEVSLADNFLTKEEKNYTSYLKKLFQIKPGDFFFHNKGNLENIIAYQLTKIYDDNFVTKEEALLKVDLQELFDLSFDQMNEYVKEEATISLWQGANPIDLDVVFTNDEYFKLKYGEDIE